MNKKNAPQWVNLISDVMDTFGDGTHTPESDKTTKAIVDSCRKRLALGKSLTDKQANALFEAIRVRTPDTEFAWADDVKLGRNQLAYARKNNAWFFAGTAAVAPGLSEYVTRAEMEAEITKVRDEFQHYFSIISAHFQHDLSDLAAAFQHGFSTEVENRPFNVNGSSLGVPDFSTELNVTKQNETNGAHERPITASRTPSEKPITRSSHPLDNEVKKNKSKAKAARTTSLFQRDAESAPTGNMEIDGETYHLVFGPYEKQLQRISSVSGDEWRRAFDREQGAVARASERQNPHARWTLSPLFQQGDTHGYRDPLPKCAAILCWNGPLIEGVWLMTGDADAELVFQSIPYRSASKTLVWKGRPRDAGMTTAPTPGFAASAGVASRDIG